MTTGRPSTVVIGIGNEYRRDDGVGIVAARRLRTQLPPEAKIIEAGGEGPSLLDAWQGARSVVLLDAVQSGALPGTIHRFDACAKPIPSGFFHYSSHAFSVAEAVELSRALHELPPHLTVYGIEGSNFAAGVGLSAVVERAVNSAVAQVVGELHGAYFGEVLTMRAYIVVNAQVGTAHAIAEAVAALPGVKMADACWGTGDVYAVVEFSAWNELNGVVMDNIHMMPDVIKTETHVAVEG